MPFARIKEFSHRLRVRLALWYGGAFAALIVAASFIVYEGLRYELVGETDFRLKEDAKETAQAVFCNAAVSMFFEAERFEGAAGQIRA